MTSPSLKRRRTTRPSTPPTADRRFEAVVDERPRIVTQAAPLRSEPLWLPAGALAVLMTLLMAISASGAETPGQAPADLGWRAGRWAPPIWQESKSAPASGVTTAQWIEPARSKSAGRASIIGTAAAANQGKVSHLRIVGTTAEAKLVAYDEPGSASVQRVYETDASWSARFAQTDDDGFGAELKRQIETPFQGEELPPGGDDLTPDELDPFDDVMSGMDDPASTDSDPEDDFGGFELAAPTDATPAPDTTPEPAVENQSPLGGGDFQPLPDQGGFTRPLTPSRRATDEERREEAQQDCAEELAEIKASRLADIDLFIGVTGDEGTDFPFLCSIDDGTPFQPRAWPEITYMWKASGLCHKPLYFEQTHVERYGHSCGPFCDLIGAGAHFFTRIPALPYCMGLKAPNECVYTLGHYRPGGCAPYLVEQPGFTWRAAGVAAGVWTGGVFLVP